MSRSELLDTDPARLVQRLENKLTGLDRHIDRLAPTSPRRSEKPNGHAPRRTPFPNADQLAAAAGGHGRAKDRAAARPTPQG